MFPPIFHLARNQLLSILILIFIGIAFSLYLFTSFRDFEKEKLSSALNKAVENRTNSFQRSIDHTLGIILSIEGLFNSSQKVTRFEFQKFTKTILHHSLSLLFSFIHKILIFHRSYLDTL